MELDQLDEIYAVQRLAETNDRAERQHIDELAAQERELLNDAKSLALNILEITGYTDDERPMKDIYDIRVSPPLSLGELNTGSPSSSHAYMKVYLERGMDNVVETKTVGRIFKREADVIEKVVSNKIETVGVGYFTGDANGNNLRYLTGVFWQMPARGEVEQIDAVIFELNHAYDIVTKKENTNQ